MISLRSKKFVLLLDDIWERIDLSKVGVSLDDNQNGSKIVFTTRSEDICGQMKTCKNYKVDCLSLEAALHLFQEKVGENVLSSHPEIPKLAEIVAKECQGLPLALITIGHAMTSRRSPREWQHAIDELQSNPPRFPGMGNHVFPILRFSYDSLSDDILKTCFLYCSIFPEGHNIRKDELIELWIGEGFLNNSDHIYNARNEGEYIIGTLKLACLLERGEHSDDFVKMHDMIRDMALWLASNENRTLVEKKHVGSSQQNSVSWNRTLVEKKHIGSSQQNSVSWNEVRMSFWGSSIESLPEAPSCPRLQTLLLRLSALEKIPFNFFDFMPTLEVLDLSYNLDLVMLPTRISELFNLRYLNLSNTNIRELPDGIKYLTRLKILLLDGMSRLEHIPEGVISSLSSLQVFSWFSTELIELQNPLLDDSSILAEVQFSDHISDVSLTLFSKQAVDRISYSDKLRSRIRRLTIMFCDDWSLQLSSMLHLESLSIVECFSEMMLSIDYFSNLRHLSIILCPGIINLTWLIHAPSLQFLTLRNCRSLREILVASELESSEIEASNDFFRNLTVVDLHSLPRLTSICPGTTPFRCLETISVADCESLRKLPFNFESAKKLNAIKGSAGWWNRLEWEDEAAKHVFAAKFHEL